MTLTQFLLARIAEEERAANAARDRIFPTTWREDVSKMRNPHIVDFVERKRPERVLAECEARRRIVNDFLDAEQKISDGYLPRRNVLYDVLHILAQPYADHPDYQREWAF